MILFFIINFNFISIFIFLNRRSLKSLAETYLKREIQTSASGHDSYEDSRATLEILLNQLKRDFRTVLRQN